MKKIIALVLTLALTLGVCASQFERCGLSQSTVSAHLATLQRAGLITSQRVGQWIFYKRNETAIAAFSTELSALLAPALPDENQ